MLLKDRIGEADPKDPTMRCPPPAVATGIAMAKIALLALGGADAEKWWGTSSLHVHRWHLTGTARHGHEAMASAGEEGGQPGPCFLCSSLNTVA